MSDLLKLAHPVPMISIVVLVHGVEEWLDECLRSILSQSFTDFELIAVDDRSPDNSMDILRRCAAGDARVRILSLEENVGQGLARNAGLAAATGEYVWFIDGDDSVRPGALREIADRLIVTGADIIVFGWERVFPDGHSFRGGQQERLASAPNIFRLSEYPELAMLAPFPWNKVVKRRLMSRYGYQFAVGIYEDVDFSLFMLAAARTVTVINKAFVNYRQRYSSAMRASGDKHLSIFDHWSRAWSLINRHKLLSPKIHSVMFAHMIRHFVSVFNNESRVQSGSRKRFVVMAQELHREFRPQDLNRPTQPSHRVENAAIATGSYVVLETMRRVRAYRSKRRGARPGDM